MAAILTETGLFCKRNYNRTFITVRLSFICINNSLTQQSVQFSCAVFFCRCFVLNQHAFVSSYIFKSVVFSLPSFISRAHSNSKQCEEEEESSC